jgi:hypothetical protein
MCEKESLPASAPNNDDLTKNLYRMVLEERLVLGVTRPAAVLSIANLPTS